MNRKQKYLRTINGLAHSIYDTQKFHSKNRGHKPPEYSFEQFYNWLINQQKFEKLYNDWIASGCENNLKPSVDRPNDYKGYSLNNIQLMTWRENKEKYYSDVKNGINTKCCKEVSQCDLQGNVLNVFFSQEQASRETGVLKQSISKSCLGQINSAGGFLWKQN